ncbi:hypothetical protein J2Z48_001032 [Croceifilum oryzae]|uniref:YqzM family protein n=1 Tax=Croceifilum oryzae TaxID=1553429 RepID=A0AAJ1WRR2_9BACL|nr:hypothetical protein [Croceifilum oryzae]MDQ0416860.1 hypothetical protein [Croceifilum oryzae]
MGSHQSHYEVDNSEYDFDDFMISASVVGGLFFVIFIGATVVQLLWK